MYVQEKILLSARHTYYEFNVRFVSQIVTYFFASACFIPKRL